MNGKNYNGSFQLAGLLMWRAGLLLAAGTGLFRSASFMLQFIELPRQLEIGIGLVFCGVVFFATSMIVERVQEARLEGDLTQ